LATCARPPWARVLKNKNVQIIGANCTLGPQSLLPILQELAGVNDLRISGMPNAGFPKREGDRIVYPKSSPEFRTVRREAAALGARILGGCCGTTPAHIRAMAEAVKSLRPVKTAAVAHVESVPKPAPVLQREPESKFWKKLKKNEFVVCVEIDPPKGIALDRVYEQVDKIMASGKVDASTSTAAPWPVSAWTRSSPRARSRPAASKPCRTSPRATTTSIGLQAMLLGAWSVGGVRNVLAITGDPPSVGDYPGNQRRV